MTYIYKLFLKLSIFVFLLTLTPYQASAASAKTSQTVAATSPTTTQIVNFLSSSSTLLFLGNQNIAPVVFLEDGKPNGVAVDLVNALKPYISKPLEVVAMDWSTAQSLVAEGKADALIQINQTDERKKIYDFSDSLLESQFSIFARESRVDIVGLSSIHGLRVGVEKGGLPELTLKEHPEIELVTIPNFIEGFEQVSNGAIDAVIVDYRVGSYTIAKNNIQGIKAMGEPIAFSFSAIAVKKGNKELLDEINNALKTIKSNGLYQAILTKWQPTETITRTQAQISREIYSAAIAVLSILFALVIAWSITINKELNLRKKAERYSKKLISSANAMIIGLDLDGKVTVFNEAAEKLTGYSKDEVLGKDWFKMITPRDRFPKVWEVFEKFINEKKSIVGDFTNPIITKNGEERVIEWRNSEIHENGKVIGTISYGIDVTEREQIEKDLALTAKELTDAQRMAHIGNWELDLKTNNLKWSDEIFEMFEINPKNFGNSYDAFLTRVHPEDRELVDKTYISSVKNHEPFQIDHRIIMRDGSVRYVHEQGETWYDNDGKPLRSAGTIQEITDRKLAEINIAKKNQSLRMLSQTNQSLIHATKEQELLDDVCRIIVNEGGYQSAWIGYKDIKNNGEIIPVAQAGLQKIPLAKDEEKNQVCNPCLDAISSKKPVVISDIEKDKTTSPWKSSALDKGFKSVITLPLIREGEAFAVLGIYASKPEIFDSSTISILKEMSEDLAFGITTLRIKEARKKAEEALAEERGLFVGGPTIVFKWKAVEGWPVEYVSPNISEQFGYTQEDLTSGHVTYPSIIHPEDLPRIGEEVEKYSKEGLESFEQTYRIKNKKGEYRWIYDFTKVSRNDKKEITYYDGYILDITDRKESEEKYHTLIEKIQTAVVVHSADTKITASNKIAGELLDLTEEQLLGKEAIDPAWQFFHEDGSKVTLDEYPVNKVIKSHSILQNYTLRVHRPNKPNDIWVLVNGNPIFNDKNEITQVVITFTNITELKKAEEELHESEEKFSAAWHSSPNILVITSLADSTILDINESFTKILGYTKEEVVGKTTIELSLWNDLNNRTSVLKELNEKGFFNNFETTFRSKSGKTVNVVDSAQVIQLNGEKYVLSSMYDITERKEAEEKFSAAWHSSPNMIAITRLSDGKIIDINEAFTKILGYSREEAIGKTTNELSIWVDTNDRVNLVKAIEEFGSVDNFETKYRNKNKEVVYGVHAARVLQVKGEKCILSSIHDITERKQEEQRKEQELIKNEALLQSLGEGMIAVDKQGNIVAINSAAENIVGWKEEEIIGKNIADAIPATDISGNAISKEDRVIFAAIASKKSALAKAMNYINKDNKRIPVSVTVTPFILNDEIIGAVNIFRDITKEQKLEETRRDLLSLASHQLRTPLSGTKWLIETLQTKTLGELTEKQGKYLENIYSINERMIHLVQDMLSVLQLESGGIAVEMKEVSVQELFDKLMITIKPVADKKNVRVQNKAKESPIQSVSSDESLLSIALDTFMTNAVQYSKEGSEIIFDVNEKDDYVVFSVKDSGIGIPEEEKDRIFERFFRASNAKNMRPDGTGLGIYIAKDLAEKLGGFVDFESKINEGTTFMLHIPR